MVRITLEIEGMACGMCEAHVNDAIRKAFTVKKVTSSHSKRKTEIIADAPIDDGKLKCTVEASGYKVLSIHTEQYEKKSFSLFHK